MIRFEKRIMPICENCEKFEVKTITLTDRVVIECVNADICSNAVFMYQKTCENTEIKSDPSPCKSCDFSDPASCCGCPEYYDWRNKYDD